MNAGVTDGLGGSQAIAGLGREAGQDTGGVWIVGVNRKYRLVCSCGMQRKRVRSCTWREVLRRLSASCTHSPSSQEPFNPPLLL